MSAVMKVSRRGILKSGAAATAGLLIGFHLPPRRSLAAQTTAATASRLNAFIHIATDDTVTFRIHKAEMGQGTMTSLAMLLAEELECDWEKIRAENAPVDVAFGSMQGVFGSFSIRESWEPLRKAGASAREMLIEAAAQKWGVEKSQCRAEQGAVVNTATGARLPYGGLAEAAARLPIPGHAPLKDPKQFRLIGKPVKRVDTAEKVDGRAQFGIDVRLPGMLHASIERCPVFGGKVAGFDATKAKALPGVKDVIQIASGIAVVADNTWAAMQGRRALEVKWDEGPNAAVNSAGVSNLLAERVRQPGAVARKDGDAEAGLAGAARKIEAVYEAPFLAHAPMEPLNCVAHVRPDGCEIWASTQYQTWSRDAAAKVAGVKPENVQVHTTFLGGGFGRRAEVDYISEAVEVSKAVGAPVKLTWSRADDIKQGNYRPASYARFAAGLDRDGWPVALMTRIACPSILRLKEGLDPHSVEGVVEMAYAIPNMLVDYQIAETPIPVTFWRSVGYSQNTFFVESFLDEVAAAGGKDPIELRRRLLAKSPRLLAVLEKAAEQSGWGKPPPSGRSRGIAVANNVGSFNAQVVEVSVSQGKLRVHRVVCAVDCGLVVNPAIVGQQIRSGIVYGLSAALKGEITIDRGRVQQSNFHDYDALRIDEMPVVDVHIVATDNAPGGIGEAFVPAIAPAVCNAIYAATGKRIRRLPIRAEDFNR